MHSPVEALRCMLETFERHGILAAQNDATELLELIHDILQAPASSANLHSMFSLMDATYRPTSDKTVAIADYVHQIIEPHHRTMGHKSDAILITKMPAYGSELSDMKWIPHGCTDWDVDIDLTCVFADVNAQGCSYKVRAAIFHVHHNHGKAIMTEGHYVMIVKQADIWHLCDDEVVRAVELTATPYPPCCLYLERCDRDSATRDSLVPAHVMEKLSWEDVLATGSLEQQMLTGSSSSMQPEPSPEPQPKKRKARPNSNPQQLRLSQWITSHGDAPGQRQDQAVRRCKGAGPDREGQGQDREGRGQDRKGQGADRAERVRA